MVPEGLVLLMSLAFAVAVLRLAKRSVLVQELPAVEGLARVDVLCIDKTGTLTEGKLSVVAVEPLDGGPSVDDALAAIAAADEHPNATMSAIGDRFPAAPSGWSSTAIGAVLLRAEMERGVVRRSRVVVRGRRRRPDRRRRRRERPRGGRRR